MAFANTAGETSGRFAAPLTPVLEQFFVRFQSGGDARLNGIYSTLKVFTFKRRIFLAGCALDLTVVHQFVRQFQCHHHGESLAIAARFFSRSSQPLLQQINRLPERGFFLRRTGNAVILAQQLNVECGAHR